MNSTYSLLAMQKISPAIEINIKDCKGDCINEVNYGGCEVTIDKTVNKVITTHDFSKAKAELCSLIFFAGGIDIQSQFRSDKKLCFSLMANGDIKDLTVEMHLNSRNPDMKISVESEWQNYTRPLRVVLGPTGPACRADSVCS